MTNALTWAGIAVCISQSAVFSGMNLAVFSLSRLRLAAAAQAGSREATRVLTLRRNANFALATILWGNVAINVLLTLLADSLLAGVTAFLFSTMVITFLGEIFPQAYFSRHALRIASRLSPLLRFYQVVLWPVAWPTSRMLDAWVGPEGMPWFRERELREVLRQHAQDATTEISQVEATGAINFLALDDIPVGQEGRPLDERSVIRLPFKEGKPVLPPITRQSDDPFLQQLNVSGQKWIILTDERSEPQMAVNAFAFTRGVLFGGDLLDLAALCHRPLILRDQSRTLGQALSRLAVRPAKDGDDVVDEDVILVWTAREKRIITGSDILGRLLRGIVREAPAAGRPDEEAHPGI